MRTDQPMLRITEIFYSLQGESSKVGIPTVFVRLTGCPLRCSYCDTSYAFKGGTLKSFETLLDEIKDYGCLDICVTGGEPLAQPECLPFLSLLCDAGYQVSLETSGERNISEVDPRVLIIMDIKTPGSAVSESNLWSNLESIKPTDEIKFVVCDRADYLWAKALIAERQLLGRAKLLFSPSYQTLAPSELANWIVEDRLPVRFQVQLHKILWQDTPGR